MPPRGPAEIQDQLDPHVCRTSNRVDLVLHGDKGNEISCAWVC